MSEGTPRQPGDVIQIEVGCDPELLGVQSQKPAEVQVNIRSLEILVNLGGVLSLRFRDRGSPSDLKNAMLVHRLASSLISDSHVYKPIVLNNLGELYVLLHDRRGQPRDFNNAVDCLNQAARLMGNQNTFKPTLLKRLAILYQDRFTRLSEMGDMNKAIDCRTQAIFLTPDGDANTLDQLDNLGNLHMRRFEALEELSDVNKAIEYRSQLIDIAPNDDEGKPGWLHDLGICYGRRFKRLGDLEDINRAIKFQSQALLSNRVGPIDKSRWLSNLGKSYQIRFQCNGELADLNEGIECQERAMALTFDGDEGHPGHLDSLGASYLLRFQRQGELSDISKATELLRQAVQLTAGGCADRLDRVSHLGLAYWFQFERSGELTDLNRAIECQSQVMMMTPDGRPGKPGSLNNIGISYARRFESLGEIEDVDKAIDCQTQAILLTPDSHPAKPSRLSSLGNCYISRFEYLHELTDLNKAIQYQKQAVDMSPDGHADKPVWLNSLGMSYQRRAERNQDLVDINIAIECLSQAMLLIPAGHNDRRQLLNNLGVLYCCRFERLGEIVDIDAAINSQNQALLLTHDGHAIKPRLLDNLGTSYARRFQRLNDVTDINKSIQHQAHSLSLIPDGHAAQPYLLKNFGLSLLYRFQRVPTSQVSYFDTAVRAFQQAAQLVVGDPRVRFNAARLWAPFSAAIDLPALPAYQRVLELVPELIWLGSTISQRYTLLKEISDVATEAASYAISHNSFHQALEWLEQGRSIVWNQILQLRSPLEELSVADPALAEHLQEVKRELERAGSRSIEMASLRDSDSDLDEEAQSHHRLAAQWDQLLGKARQIPGFEDFLRPRKAAALMQAARDGPIVVINVHESCDALIIRPHSPELAHIPLKNFSLEKAMTMRATMTPLIGRQGITSDTRHLKLGQPWSKQSFKTMLAILWSDVAQPILDFLGYTNKLPEDELPRLTWCTTGALSFLPLHAAGCYDGSHPSVFDLVVSSYTPTLSALLAATPQSTDGQSGVLAIGQENTKGLSRLPCTQLELATISGHAKAARYLQLEDDNATVETVLKAMEEYSWVHLACHASQQTDDPTQSAFHLHDGNLMLSTITKRAFKNKGLAFLSACQTATGSKQLPDEAAHLAAGMLMAGYPSVIATMWAIQDEDAPEIAREVYADLLIDGKMDCTGASRALHRAVRHLQTKVGEESFERWAPFVHIGI